MRDISILISNGINAEYGIQEARDIELYNDSLDYFLFDINRKVNNLKNYINALDLTNYAKEIESIKKQAKLLGFIKLSDITYKHEINAKTKDFNYINANFQELTNEIEHIVDTLEIYFGKKEVEKQLEKNSVKKILVVDDSNLVRNLLKKMINNNYEILTAEDGKEAIDLLNANRTELVGILLDLNMPNVNGFQVLEFLKQNNLFETIGTSIITGDDSKETILKAFNYPIVDVLAKPFNENDVQRVITAMLTHK